MKQQELRIKIKEAELIEQLTKHPGEKIAVWYLIRKLKDKLKDLMFPQPKEL